MGFYGSFLELEELQPGACAPYSVPPSGEATLNYRGLPYDLLEDLLPQSGAWKQVAPTVGPPASMRPMRRRVFQQVVRKAAIAQRRLFGRRNGIGCACAWLQLLQFEETPI